MKVPYSTKVMLDLTSSVSKSSKSFGNLLKAMYNGGSTRFFFSLEGGDMWLEPKSRELFYNTN